MICLILMTIMAVNIPDQKEQGRMAEFLQKVSPQF